MKKALHFLLWIVLGMLISTGPSAAQSQAHSFEKLLGELFPSDGPGGTALVAKNGEIVFHKAFGKADLGFGLDMKLDHSFGIGSITKQFTSCAILRLMEEGKLALDDDITRFIPDYPTHGHHISIEHLLTHTSGIKSFTRLKEWDKEFWKKDLSPSEMIEFFKNEPMDFAPGEDFLYNDSGYFLLGHIVEIVSGMSYGDYLDETFFRPIGMNNTYVGSNHRVAEDRASGYKRNSSNEYENADYISMTQPHGAGVLFSTVEDLSKWYDGLYEGKVINKTNLEKAQTSFLLDNNEPTGYGYGWFVGDLKGSSMVQHIGTIMGYHSSSLYLLEEKVFVAVLANCDCHLPWNAAFKMAGISIEKPLVWETIELSEKDLASYEGKYGSDFHGERVVVFEGEKIFFGLNKEGKRQIFPFGKDSFFFDDDFATLSFKRDTEGEIIGVVKAGIQSLRWNRIVE